MKASAIIRIVVFSLIFLILLGLLIGGLSIGYLIGSGPSGETTTIRREIDVANLHDVEIDWAAGSVTIRPSPSATDKIIIYETKDINSTYTMSTEFDDNTLKISYGKDLGLHFGSLTGKDLTIILPRNWTCRNLEIDGAALEVDITGVAVGSLELNGAATELSFTGELLELECNGAAAELNVSCTKFLNQVKIDGAACKLDLTLPEECGFEVSTEGLAMDFHSDCDYYKNGSTYSYGDEYCKIDVSGLGCKVSVNPS